jgi:hypothetical protein
VQQYAQLMEKLAELTEALQREIAVWQADRNRRKVKINWSFRTTDARLNLNRLYPASPQASEPCAQPAAAA